MKRIISLILICMMLLCTVSCKRRPPDDVTTDVPAQGSIDDAEKTEDKTDAEKTEDELSEKTDDDKTDINSEKENNDEKAAQNNKDNVQDISENSETDNNVEETESDTPSADSKPTTGPESWVTITEEKAPPCEATLEDEFEAGEVLVDIMREQSAARQEYTAADFPGVDIKEISVIMNYYPDSNNHLGLLIKLNKQDKESVLKAVEVLEQNPIVWGAVPNYCGVVINA